MNRRQFLKAAPLALPALTLTAPFATASEEVPCRFSTDERDAGYAAWKRLVDSGSIPRVFLDGVEERNLVMADSNLGMVTRIVDNNTWVADERLNREHVYGSVRIEIVPKV